jgi:hypothetical protein
MRNLGLALRVGGWGRFRRCTALGQVVLAAVALAVPAPAQTAADKATAREAATEGINLYRAGKYADALDRLRRAQSLYDAPVHLLYIARAQDKLGQLVEAAENYRLLDHYTLPAGAPAAWTAAVEDGRKELAALEPRIPKLRIVTSPGNVTDATLRIDGANVSSAVIGIPRPANPGKHHVVLSAPGFALAEADAELAEGETKDVTVTLTAEATAATAGAATAPTPAPTKPEGKATESRALVGFLGGLRLGVGVPTGTLLKTNGTQGVDLPTSDGFGAGGALELHVGVRIARYFTPVVYAEGEALAPGPGFAGSGKIQDTTAGALGIGVMIGSAPNKLGGFGEIDLIPASTFGLGAPGVTGGRCNVTAHGTALRIGGGGVFPISTWLHLTPVVLATIGRFTSLDASGDCTFFPSGDIPSENRRTHGMVLFGVGGDVVLGRDL